MYSDRVCTVYTFLLINQNFVVCILSLLRKVCGVLFTLSVAHIISITCWNCPIIVVAGHLTIERDGHVTIRVTVMGEDLLLLIVGTSLLI